MTGKVLCGVLLGLSTYYIGIWTIIIPIVGFTLCCIAISIRINEDIDIEEGR